MSTAEPAKTIPQIQADDRLTAELLGFEPETPGIAWRKALGGRRFAFRILRTLEELTLTEALQREVLGFSELEILSGSALVSCAETGGDVIGAFFEGEDGLIGICIGYGGYLDFRPRLLSEMLAVWPRMRSFGVGTELKKLQAAIALARGFDEMTWTVDPLRAANARLNIEKLGAYCNHYEENRYGQAFGAGLYGDLPSDRLHMTWEIGSAAVRDRLLGKIAPLTAAEVEDLLHFDPARPEVERAFVYLPSDIDALLARDFQAALDWRLRLRETLQHAFGLGFAITGFVPAIDSGRGLSAYVLSKRGAPMP